MCNIYLLFSLICKAEIPHRKLPMQFPTDWVCRCTFSKWKNSTRAVEGHCQARQVRGREPHTTPPSPIVDRQFLWMGQLNSWKNLILFFMNIRSFCSSVKLRQHTQDAKEITLYSCLRQQVPQGEQKNIAKTHIQCSLKDSSFVFGDYTKYSKLIPFPPPLKQHSLSLGLITHLVYCEFGNLAPAVLRTFA